MNVLLILGVGILGAVFGSFFNCVINADERGLNADSRGNFPCGSIFRRRSACPKCGHKLGILDLIPILSFIFLRGRCRYCKQKISWQYPIVEIITAILFIFVASFYLFSVFSFQFSVLIFLIRDLFFVSVLLLLFVFDLKYGIIPDRISISAIILATSFNVLLIFTASLPVIPTEVIAFGETPQNAVAGTQILKLFLAILIGGGFFFAQHLISKGKWVGGGDIRLGVLMGAMLSWPTVLIALFLAYVAGAIYGIVALILKKKTLQGTVPFGTFLTVTTFITLFFGDMIIKWYIGLI